MRRGITVTRRGFAWAVLVIFLASIGVLAGYCAVSKHIYASQGFGVLALVVAAAIAALWLHRDKLHQPGRHRS